jgi:hypothetical protein
MAMLTESEKLALAIDGRVLITAQCSRSADQKRVSESHNALIDLCAKEKFGAGYSTYEMYLALQFTTDRYASRHLVADETGEANNG